MQSKPVSHHISSRVIQSLLRDPYNCGSPPELSPLLTLARTKRVQLLPRVDPGRLRVAWGSSSVLGSIPTGTGRALIIPRAFVDALCMDREGGLSPFTSVSYHTFLLAVACLHRLPSTPSLSHNLIGFMDTIPYSSLRDPVSPVEWNPLSVAVA